MYDDKTEISSFAGNLQNKDKKESLKPRLPSLHNEFEGNA